MGFFSSKKEQRRDLSPSGSDTSSSNLSVGSEFTAGSSPLSSRTSSPAAPIYDQPCANLSWADAQFRETFHNGVYTSLVMIDFLIRRRGLSYDDWLRDRSTVLDSRDYQEYCARISSEEQSKDTQPHEFQHTKAWLRQIQDSEFSVLYNNGTGRCTSFAIQTVSCLDREHPRSYTFHYYKLGVHHLARCAQSGVVIDSSSKRGAFILKPGQEMSVISVDRRYSNKWVFLSPSVSRFTKIPQYGRKRLPLESEAPEPTSWREALQNCLIDMACREQVLIFFRGYDTERPRYYGMIKFFLQNRVEIVLSGSVGAKYPPRFVFGGGNEQTDEECRKFLSSFVQFGSEGRSFLEQYRKCEHVVQNIWDAAIRVYGYPQLMQSSLGVPTEGARTAMAGIWTPGSPGERSSQ